VSFPAVTLLRRPDVLFLAPESLTASLGPSLRTSFTVSITSTIDTGREFLRRVPSALVVIDLDHLDCSADAAQICREARQINPSTAVLVTAQHPETVPEALIAGCDSVLLKPYQPNLFYGRVGRLLRSEEGMRRTYHARPDVQCPKCGRENAVAFEFVSREHAWHACLGCRHVWVAPDPASGGLPSETR